MARDAKIQHCCGEHNHKQTGFFDKKKNKLVFELDRHIAYADMHISEFEIYCCSFLNLPLFLLELYEFENIIIF